MLGKTREQERHGQRDRKSRMLRCAMNGNVIVGITGHQKRRGLDWNWVSATLGAELAALGNVSRALSSLAAGADQRFASAALELGIPVSAVLPMSGYERFLRGRDLARYQALLARCDQLVLDGKGRPNEAFLAAGRYIVDHCDVLFAVWDGLPAGAMGGTGDVVEYARQSGRRIVHIDPLAQTVAGSAVTR
jgi:hypothetical protein